MRIKNIIVFLSIILSYQIWAQEYKIKINISRLSSDKVYLASVYGDKLKIIDSTKASDGSFVFELSDQHQPGIYKLTFSKPAANQPSPELDIIFNKENISVSSDYYYLYDSLVVNNSLENRIYYDFLKKENEFQKKLELLHPLVIHFPKDDKLYNDLTDKYNKLQNERKRLVEQVINKNPNTYAARIINMYKSPFLDAYVTEGERINAFRLHYFDELDMSDELLLNSSVYKDKIIQYLKLFRNSKLLPAQQEEEFIKAVDIIMSKTNENSKVYDFAINYLVHGFELFKMEKVLNHIAENYLEKGCETDNKTLMQKRLAAYQKMAVGKQAPDIEINDINNNRIKLSEIDNPYTLVLFWANWCPHCNQLLPDLKKWYNNENSINLEILAFSLDTVLVKWEEAVLQSDYDWINCSELKGWDSEVAHDYNIYATPTMFLLDRNRTILSKPLTFREFVHEIVKY